MSIKFIHYLSQLILSVTFIAFEDEPVKYIFDFLIFFEMKYVVWIIKVGPHAA